MFKTANLIVTIVAALVPFGIANAQQQGPQGVYVTFCLRVTPDNSTFRFYNTCNYVIEVAVVQLDQTGRHAGATTFQLFPAESFNFGYRPIGTPQYWACSAPNGPMSESTHASPTTNSYRDVICPTGGSAGGLR